MTAAHTCRCGVTTRICRDEVTDEQWAQFETLHRLAFAWAVDHFDGDAEEFAERFAGDMWDDPAPCSFPAFQEADRKRRAELERVARVRRNAEIKATSKKADATRRRAVRALARGAVRTETVTGGLL